MIFAFGARGSPRSCKKAAHLDKFESERGLSNMIFAFGARRKVCGAKERN